MNKSFLDTTLARHIKKGEIWVIPTDTLYGVVGLALNKYVVRRLYLIKNRPQDKPMLILINEINDLRSFNIYLNNNQLKFLQNIWPNRISVLLPCQAPEFAYLHRGTNFLGFRIPKNEKLRAVLKETGPLVAPSANIAGEIPAQSIKEARRYFKDKVDGYVDYGLLNAKASTIIKFINNEFIVVREGELREFDIQTLSKIGKSC